MSAMSKERAEIAPGITVDRDEGFGKPVIKGTAVEVDEVLRRLAEGESMESLASDCELSLEGIRAALAYAAEIVEEEPKARGDHPVEEVSSGVVKDPAVRFGKAVLKGRRVDVASVLGFLAAGESFDEITSEYAVTHQQMRDALRFGYSLLARERVSAP